jgi:hypothetical protein
MSNPWNEVPVNLRPRTANDEATLLKIANAVRQAVLLRHDFQTTLSNNIGERRLRPVPMKSAYAMAKKRTPIELSQQHAFLMQRVTWYISLLDNAVLKDYLSKRIVVLFPDIGMSRDGKALMRLNRPTSVLDRINPLLSDVDLILLLDPFSRNPKIRRDAFYY